MIVDATPSMEDIQDDFEDFKDEESFYTGIEADDEHPDYDDGLYPPMVELYDRYNRFQPVSYGWGEFSYLTFYSGYHPMCNTPVPNHTNSEHEKWLKVTSNATTPIFVTENIFAFLIQHWMS